MLFTARLCKGSPLPAGSKLGSIGRGGWRNSWRHRQKGACLVLCQIYSTHVVADSGRTTGICSSAMHSGPVAVSFLKTNSSLLASSKCLLSPVGRSYTLFNEVWFIASGVVLLQILSFILGCSFSVLEIVLHLFFLHHLESPLPLLVTNHFLLINILLY